MNFTALIFGFVFTFFPQTPEVSETVGFTLLQKVTVAQEMLNTIPLGLETKIIVRSVKSKKGIMRVETKRVVGREVLLVAWDPDGQGENAFHVIRFSIPHPFPTKGFAIFVKNGEYEVIRVSGSIPMKFVFRARLAGKPLIVLAGKYWWLPRSAAKEQDVKKFMAVAKEFVYSPFADDFYIDELRIVGGKFLFDTVERVQMRLNEQKIISRAYPEELLGGVIKTDWVVNLGLNEQMDHGKFNSNRRRSAVEIAIEYALNLDKSYSRIESSANARGAYQFTNRWKGKRPGTYDRIVQQYREVGLIADFAEGTQNLENMIAMAFCLLDAELAQLPKEARELYKKDYRAGSIFPTAGYNGGGGRAWQVWNWVQRKKIKLAYDTPLPRPAFGGRKGAETYVYIQKHQFLWEFIDELKKELMIPSN